MVLTGGGTPGLFGGVGAEGGGAVCERKKGLLLPTLFVVDVISDAGTFPSFFKRLKGLLLGLSAATGAGGAGGGGGGGGGAASSASTSGVGGTGETTDEEYTGGAAGGGAGGVGGTGEPCGVDTALAAVLAAKN